MTHQVHAFEPPERFVAGTVGPPGDRTFYLQARGGGRVISVALEKVQVSLLADKLEELLDEVRLRFGVDTSQVPRPDNAPLDTPVDEEFRVGTLGLAWDTETTMVVIEAVEVGGGGPGGTESDSELDRLRVRITPSATRQFIDRARRILAAGRPPCPLCGQPLDPVGHLCPRHNGYHRQSS